MESGLARVAGNGRDLLDELIRSSRKLIQDGQKPLSSQLTRARLRPPLCVEPPLLELELAPLLVDQDVGGGEEGCHRQTDRQLRTLSHPGEGGEEGRATRVQRGGAAPSLEKLLESTRYTSSLGTDYM